MEFWWAAHIEEQWAAHRGVVSSPQLPPHLVPTNESERHLSEPIKPTELPAAPQSAPGLSRGCSRQLRTFNPESGRQQI